MLSRWGQLYHVSYVLIRRSGLLTRWVTFEVHVEGDTTEFGSAEVCTLVDIIVIHGGKAHIAKSRESQYSDCDKFWTMTYALLEACLFRKDWIYPVGVGAAEATEL
jgi:hypothetical protein